MSRTVCHWSICDNQFMHSAPEQPDFETRIEMTRTRVCRPAGKSMRDRPAEGVLESEINEASIAICFSIVPRQGEFPRFMRKRNRRMFSGECGCARAAHSNGLIILFHHEIRPNPSISQENSTISGSRRGLRRIPRVAHFEHLIGRARERQRRSAHPNRYVSAQA